MRYLTHILITLIFCGWLLAGCERRSGGKEVIREILSGSEISTEGVLEPGSEELLRAIGSLLRTDDAGAPLEIVNLLHQLPDGRNGAMMLVEAMKSRDLDLRRNAVAVLGLLRADWSIPLLRRAADDSSPSVRRGALHGLSIIDPDGARFLFLLGLKDGAWEVRAEAAAALGQLKDPSTLKYLMRGLDEKDNFALYHIVMAICDIAGEDEVDDFQALLSNPKSPLHAGVAIIMLARNEALENPDLLKQVLLESAGDWRLLGVEPYAELEPLAALQLAEQTALTNPSLSSALRSAVQNSTR